MLPSPIRVLDFGGLSPDNPATTHHDEQRDVLAASTRDYSLAALPNLPCMRVQNDKDVSQSTEFRRRI